MKLPDLSDTDAMIARGRESALFAARKQALEELRDAFTRLMAIDWKIGQKSSEIRQRCEDVSDALRDVHAVALMFQTHTANFPLGVKVEVEELNGTTPLFIGCVGGQCEAPNVCRAAGGCMRA